MEDKQYQIDLLTAMNERLMNSEHVYRLACEFSGAAYIYFDLKNRRRVEMFGDWDTLSGESLKRQPYDESFMLSLVFDDDQKLLRDHLIKNEVKEDESNSIEIRSKNGKKWIRATRNVIKDANNVPVEKIVTFEDITKIKQKTEETEYFAYHDVLTGLYNRNHFFTILRDLMAKADKEHTSVEFMLVDVDNFKKINDSLGLVYGDELVQELAMFIKTLESDKVKIGRYGSDVFCVAIYDPCGKNCSDMIFKIIRDRLKKPFILTNKAEVNISVSAGVSEYPGGGENALEIIKNTEIVLYSSKQTEKGSITFYNDEILKKYHNDILLEDSLADAVKNNQLEVYFQPLFELESGKMRGAEALVRWIDEDGRVIHNPLEFIPIAEKNGTIIEIGNFVFNEVFKSIHEWYTKFRANFVISINVSALQLEKPDFIDNLLKLADLYEINTSLVELEITESVLINDFEGILETLNQLSQIGFKISLDDFGTGFSSLSYLRELPISTLKIDKSFIDDVCSDSKTADITGSIIGMGKQLNLETVAEGVELEEQLEFLQQKGCENIQGFIFSKPVNKSEFEKIIIRHLP